MNRLASIPVVCALVLLAGCGESETQGSQAAGPTPAADYRTQTLVRQPVTAERLVNGRIEAVNQGTISAQTGGEVTEIVHDVSEEVEAGAVVLRLRAVQQRAGLRQAEAAVREATSQLAEAEARYTRVADLVSRQLAATADLDEVVAYRDAIRARLDAARAAQSAAAEGLSYTEVTMPYTGVITDRHVQIGEIVGPGAPVFDAAALGQLRVISDISQDLALQLQDSGEAVIYVDNQRIPASKVTVYPRAADNTATFRVRLDLPPGLKLLPGMFVKVGIITGTEDRLLLPAAAVVRRGEVVGTYVKDPSGRTVFRQIRLGQQESDGHLEVLSGLVEGDEVALEPDLAMRHLFASDRVGE